MSQLHALNSDTVRFFIEKTRVVQNSIYDAFDDGRGNGLVFSQEVLRQESRHEGLVEESIGDLTQEELIELIEDLNIDEAADLLAVAWLGQGKYASHEFSRAWKKAESLMLTDIIKDLSKMSLLPERLESGLDVMAL